MKAAIKELQRAEEPAGFAGGVVVVVESPPTAAVANSASVILGFIEVATHPQAYFLPSDNPEKVNVKENALVLVSALQKVNFVDKVESVSIVV